MSLATATDWINIISTDIEPNTNRLQVWDSKRIFKSWVIKTILRNREKNANGPGDIKTMVRRVKEHISKTTGIPIEEIKTENEKL